MQRFEKIKTNKEALMELLKIADPDPEMVMRYLPESDVYALYEDGEAVCVAAVAPVSKEACELKNIAAVRPGQGYGSRMMAYLFRQYKGRYSAMTVGTADTSTANKAFYAKHGFVYTHTQKNFFTDHYKEPVYENGVRCVDMEYFIKRFD